MITEDLYAALLRISPHAPVDLDTPTIPSAATGDGGHDAPDWVPLSERLWTRPLPERAYIGIWVDGPLPDVAGVALRLAAIALERQVHPVILSTLPTSGFEGLGFRVERLPTTPGPERDRAEDDLRKFWSLSLIIDAGDIDFLT